MITINASFKTSDFFSDVPGHDPEQIITSSSQNRIPSFSSINGIDNNVYTIEFCVVKRQSGALTVLYDNQIPSGQEENLDIKRVSFNPGEVLTVIYVYSTAGSGSGSFRIIPFVILQNGSLSLMQFTDGTLSPVTNIQFADGTQPADIHELVIDTNHDAGNFSLRLVPEMNFVYHLNSIFEIFNFTNPTIPITDPETIPFSVGEKNIYLLFYQDLHVVPTVEIGASGMIRPDYDNGSGEIRHGRHAFYAVPTNGGGGPMYEWHNNLQHDPIGHGATFNYSIHVGESIWCIMTSSNPLAKPVTARSEHIISRG